MLLVVCRKVCLYSWGVKRMKRRKNETINSKGRRDHEYLLEAWTDVYSGNAGFL